MRGQYAGGFDLERDWELTGLLVSLEARAVDAEARAVDAEARAVDAEARAVDAEARAVDAEARAVDAEASAVDAEARAVDAAAERDAAVAAYLKIQKTRIWRWSRPLRLVHSLVRAVWGKGKKTAVICRNLSTKGVAVSSFASTERRYRGPLDPTSLRVSIVLVNYNHGPFLHQRLDSLAAQTHRPLEIVIFDDCSSDDSWQVIEDFAFRHPGLVKIFRASENGGNVFASWQSAYSRASGELVWLVESDDFAEPDFLERLVGYFEDQSVLLAFGKTEFADAQGKVQPGLDDYRNSAMNISWREAVKKPAHVWFSDGFATHNLIPNVGGCVFRNQAISEEEWATASGFKVFGDWFLYSRISRGGQVVFDPSAVAYFRIHGQNLSSSRAQSTRWYFEEYLRLLELLRMYWNLGPSTMQRSIERAKTLHKTARARFTFEELQWSNLTDEAETEGVEIHVLLGMLSISVGGGEIFPIHLANELVDRGVRVSVLVSHEQFYSPDVRRRLDVRVPIYSAQSLESAHPQQFVRDLGVTIVHSHFAGVEELLLRDGDVGVPYVVTTHGSYEAMGVSLEKVRSWAKHIGTFAYTAQKNIDYLAPVLDPAKNRVVRVVNGLPPKTSGRLVVPEDLGFTDQTFIFVLVSRAVEGKGWLEAISAFRAVEDRFPTRELGLLLVGDGELRVQAMEQSKALPNVNVFGTSHDVQGLMALSSCLLLPSRFSGESFPVVLLEAMQAGCPVIATDIGEVVEIVEGGSLPPAGLTIPVSLDDSMFVESLTQAMSQMVTHEDLGYYRIGAEKRSSLYTIRDVASDYLALYREAMEDLNP
jgi:glycosyltransferase involved in cell wall biosynthesis